MYHANAGLTIYGTVLVAGCNDPIECPTSGNVVEILVPPFLAPDLRISAAAGISVSAGSDGTDVSAPGSGPVLRYGAQFDIHYRCGDCGDKPVTRAVLVAPASFSHSIPFTHKVGGVFWGDGGRAASCCCCCPALFGDI